MKKKKSIQCLEQNCEKNFRQRKTHVGHVETERKDLETLKRLNSKDSGAKTTTLVEGR